MTVFGYWRCSTDLQDEERQVIALQAAGATEVYGEHITGVSNFGDRPELSKCLEQLKSGDTLLINGTGRTDFQNGNAKDAYNSIFNKLLKLPEETLLYPAHDYKGEKVSTIGKEKKQNPRLQVNSVDEYIDIMKNLNLKKPAEIETNVSRNINLGA